MYFKICKCCGERFFTKSDLKKYCSKTCSRKMAQKRREETGQLCWRCAKACGGCNWSRHLEPIDGWVAEITVVKDSMGDFQSYSIKKCPEFVRV